MANTQIPAGAKANLDLMRCTTDDYCRRDLGMTDGCCLKTVMTSGPSIAYDELFKDASDETIAKMTAVNMLFKESDICPSKINEQKVYCSENS